MHLLSILLLLGHTFEKGTIELVGPNVTNIAAQLAT